MWQPKRVLAISSHADDVELGAGGTIAKWAGNGSVVYHIILSTLKQKQIRLPEIYAANKALGVPKENIIVHDFENKRFDEHRQDILQILHDALELKPDVIITHCSFDTHQDHEVVYKESVRAFRNRTILGYEDPWNTYESNLRLTVVLENKNIRAKCRAIRKHKSQADRAFMNQNFIVGMAMMRGMTIKQDLAENFEVIRWVL